jgi:ubiquinone/menaquinone biosynthesis C-methylase UbiE
MQWGAKMQSSEPETMPMGFYERYVLPGFINLACGTSVFRDKRAKLVTMARGVVLDVGAGSGHNFPYYDPSRIEKLYALEPSEGMRRLARKREQQVPFPLEWLALPGEQIPLPDASVDTVVLTFTLCTIPDWQAALAQIKRVLKADGKLLFCEHGLAPEPGVQKWQHRINPGWKKCAGGCHLNRPIADYLREAGFHIQELNAGYLPSTPRIAGFVSSGIATVSDNTHSSGSSQSGS